MMDPASTVPTIQEIRQGQRTDVLELFVSSSSISNEQELLARQLSESPQGIILQDHRPLQYWCLWVHAVGGRQFGIDASIKVGHMLRVFGLRRIPPSMAVREGDPKDAVSRIGS